MVARTEKVLPEPGFSAADRVLGEDDRITLTTVGVDIGSATCHVIFSLIELKRTGISYSLTRGQVLYESPVTLTPYRAGNEIDELELSRFVRDQYGRAGVGPDEVDTGAVILTGVALLRRNARAIADVFAGQAGKFVSVGAGDNLEGMLAAHGSGAVRLSAGGGVLNIDIGGGTTKVALCRDGAVEHLTALDVGARLVAYDQVGRISRLEPAATRISAQLGLGLAEGARFSEAQGAALAAFMIDELLGETSAGGVSRGSRLLRGAALPDRSGIEAITFSGGVSEYIYGRSGVDYGDLGRFLGAELLRRLPELGAPVRDVGGGIRATVIGASQYSVQVSGSTIYISDPALVPVRNVPVVVPAFEWDDLDDAAVTSAVSSALSRLDMDLAEQPVAIALAWGGSATFGRLDTFCTGVVRAMNGYLARGHPLILVSGNDIGGLIGLHLAEEMAAGLPVISVDAIELRELDYIDIGAFVPGSGAVPVLVKSLLFAAAAQPRDPAAVKS